MFRNTGGNNNQRAGSNERGRGQSRGLCGGGQQLRGALNPNPGSLNPRATSAPRGGTYGPGRSQGSGHGDQQTGSSGRALNPNASLLSPTAAAFQPGASAPDPPRPDQLAPPSETPSRDDSRSIGSLTSSEKALAAREGWTVDPFAWHNLPSGPTQMIEPGPTWEIRDHASHGQVSQERASNDQTQTARARLAPHTNVNGLTPNEVEHLDVVQAAGAGPLFLVVDFVSGLFCRHHRKN